MATDVFNNRKSDIKIKEILMFVELARTQNIRELSRKTGVGPGQISKLIKSLETKTNLRLLERSSKGVSISIEAKQHLPYFEKVYQQHLKFQDSLVSESSTSTLSFAATSFLSSYVLAPVIADVTSFDPKLRFRVFDLSPDDFTSVGLRSGFQYALHIGNIDWPKTWFTQKVGSVQWKLYAKVDHELGQLVDEHQIKEYPFVYPVYWAEDGMRLGQDGCPLSYSKRVKGHETSTAQTAVEIVLRTDQVGFLPEIIGQHYVKKSKLKEVKVKQWEKVERPLYFSVKNDLVKKSTFDLLFNSIQSVILDSQA